MASKAELHDAIDQITAKYNAKYGKNISARFVKAIIQAESSYNPSAISDKGAIGLGQIMPETGADYGMSPEDLKDPIKNIITTVKHIDKLSGIFDDPRLVMAAYNAGQGNVLAANGKIPNFPETRAYVKKVGTIYNSLPEDSEDIRRSEAVQSQGSPFKNIFDEVGARYKLGEFANQPELQKRFLEKRFGKGNVVEQDGSLFARENPNEPLRPINPGREKDKLNIGQPLSQLIKSGELQSNIADIAGAIPGITRAGADIALSGGGAALGGLGGAMGGTALAEGLSEKRILDIAHQEGLLTDDEYNQKVAIDPQKRAILGAALTGGVGAAGSALKALSKTPQSQTILGNAAKFFNKIKVQTRALEGSRIQDKLTEQKIKSFTQGANPDEFAKEISDGLAKSYKAKRQVINNSFNRAREMSAGDIQAKDLYNSTFDPRGAYITEPPVLNARTTDLSGLIAEVRDSLPEKQFKDFVDFVQAPLKSKVPVDQFTGNNLIDIEVANTLQAATDLQKVYKKSTEPFINSKITQLKSAANASLDTVGESPVGKQILKARNDLLKLENETFNDEMFDIMTPTRQTPSGEIIPIEELRPSTSDVLNTVFKKADVKTKAKIRGEVNNPKLFDEQAPKVAIVDQLTKKSAVQSTGSESLINEQALANLSPEARDAAFRISQFSGPTSGLNRGGGLEDIGKQALKEVETLGGEKNVGAVTDKLNKRTLNRLVFGGQDETTGQLSQDALSGLVSPESYSATQNLLKQGVESEMALGSIGTKGAQSTGGSIPTNAGQAIKKGANFLGVDFQKLGGDIAGGASEGLEFTDKALQSIPRGSTTGTYNLIQNLLGQPQIGDEEQAQRLRGRVQFNQR